MNNKNIDLRDTPKFESPPVVETLLSVQFKPLVDMRITHFGRFQQLLEPQGFKIVQEHPRLLHQIEQKQAISRLFPSSMMFLPELPRVWLLSPESEAGQQLIQLQNDRLVLNWRTGNVGGARYPSYSRNRAEFQETLSLLLRFMSDNQLGKFTPDQCEVVYVNQIQLDGFAGPEDAFKTIFDVSLPGHKLDHVSSEPENIAFTYTYWNEPLNGRLNVQASTISLTGTASEMIDFRLSARGAPSSQSDDGVMKWLDLGHYYIVNTFADMTTELMHRKWERKKQI